MALDKLKKMRVDANLTYKQVAEYVGISKEYYWMIENGKRRLSYEIAVKIAKVFNANPDEIFLHSELTSSEQNKSKEAI